MYDFGEDFLAHTAFPRDAHREVSRCDPCSRFQGRIQQFGGANDAKTGFDGL